MQKSRTRKLLAIVLTFALVVSLLAGLGVTANAAPAWSGSGTEASPYLIANATDLNTLATDVNGGTSYANTYFRLTNSFAVSSTWAGIGAPTITSNTGTSSPMAGGKGFGGNFDGNNQTLTIARTASTSGVGGIFNYVLNVGTIRNLTVAGSLTVTGGVDAVGGIVGYNSGRLNNLTNNATVTASNAFNVGGIVGFNNGQYYHVSEARVTPPVGVIVNSINAGNITGRTKIGGITGQNAGVITFCANTGNITTTTTSGGVGAGGIAGRNGNNNAVAEQGIIKDCYNKGTIDLNNTRWGGGITGFNNALSTVQNSYNTGTVINIYQYGNAIIGANENLGAQEAFTNYCVTAFSSSGTVVETGVVPSMSMTTDAFRGHLETGTSQAGQWAWASGTNGGYPYFLRTATVPQPHGVIADNTYAVVYLSPANGNDGNAGNTTGNPVKTLSRALIVASLSSNPAVYVHVLDTITVSDTQGAFGAAIPVVWKGSSGYMFSITGTGSLTVGGIYIDGQGITTAVNVANGGSFTIRNNASIGNCGTAINVASGGSLTVNRSAIGGTTSISLANATSSCTLVAGPGQATAITGTIALNDGTGSSYAYLKIGSTLENIVGSLRILPEEYASGRIVAMVVGTYPAFSSSDLNKFAYSGGGHGFVLNGNSTQINLA